jgi:predicted nucleotide-binding protein
MATRRSAAPPPVAPKLELSRAAIERGIGRLQERIEALRAFDIKTISSTSSPELNALSAAIQDTLIRCFGENTSAYNRFKTAAALSWFPGYISLNGPHPAHECQQGVANNLEKSVALLQEAQRVLNEDLADAAHEVQEPQDLAPTASPALSRRVFVVHGHDDGARETVARFLEKIDFEPIILHEQASRNRTVIEKIEAHREVGFAVVLLTPDDEGCVKGGKPEPRARQNVLIELGYFMGHLGRDKVCALKRGELDIPSDFAGVVWVSMDAGNGWKQSLGQELEAAGHEVNWNKVMRP